MNIPLKDNCDSWKPELAYDFVNEHFEEISTADAIMCGNDALAGEAIHALAERGYAGKIYVTGQDGDLEACQRIVEGTQLMTVYKPVERLAKLAAECAVKLAKKQPLENVSKFNDGKHEIPYIAIEPIAVFKDNIDEVIINSGFHQYEEVYMNVNGNKNSK
jgi:D-xylose transport system substrate-binding protein